MTNATLNQILPTVNLVEVEFDVDHIAGLLTQPAAERCTRKSEAAGAAIPSKAYMTGLEILSAFGMSN
jgi:hypothetical protein